MENGNEIMNSLEKAQPHINDMTTYHRLGLVPILEANFTVRGMGFELFLICGATVQSLAIFLLTLINHLFDQIHITKTIYLSAPNGTDNE